MTGKPQRSVTSLGISCLVLLWVTACSAPVKGPDGPSTAPPQFTGVKIGKPYEIGGKWYYPKEDPFYDETGVASWYGPGFHGRKTANGEIYNQYDLTAAHPTLPMPSIVEVTNLENGRSLQLRINDRGPFHDNRIIDLSKASARKLGVTGLAKVRVRFLREETQAFIDSKGKTTVPSTRATRLARAATEPAAGRGNSRQQQARIGRHEGHVPLQIADNRRALVQSAPVTSVETSGLPTIIRSAHGISAPRPEVPSETHLQDRYDEATAFQSVQVAEEDRVPLRYQPFKGQPDIRLQAQVKESGKERREDRNLTARPESLPDAQAAYAEAAGWVIKVAAYSQRQNAQKMIGKLRSLGNPVIESATVNGQQWYRVLLHPTRNQNPSQLLTAIRRLGAHDAHVM